MAEIAQESVSEPVKAESPTPTFTEASKASSPSGLDAKALAKEVAEILRPDFEKVAQSTKDKRIARLEKAVGIDLSELEEMGVTIPENVKTEARLRRLEARESAPVQEASSGRGDSSDSEQASKVMQEAGIDANSPEGIGLLRGTYRNLDHFRAEAYSLKLRLANRPAPSPSAAPAAQAEASPQGTDAEALKKEWTKFLQDNRGNKFAIQQKRTEMRKKGLADFSI